MPLTDFFDALYRRLYLLRKIYVTRFFRIYYSQFGEDTVLRDWIPKKVRTGFYVDVGCYHPKKFSNTYLLYKRGWRGINIDMDDIKIDAFRIARPGDVNVCAAVSDRQEEVTVVNWTKYNPESAIMTGPVDREALNAYSVKELRTVTLAELIRDTPYHQKQIDLLSIDTEGHDLNVLKSLDIDLYRPKIIIIELLNAPDVRDVLRSDLYQFLAARDYILFNWVGYSLFFRPAEADRQYWLNRSAG